MNALAFQNTTFDVVDRDGQPWLKAADIARALGYAREDSVGRIYDRNRDEFTPAMCETVKLTVSRNGGVLNNEVRIFSLRGAHLIAMFARTAVAKAFRRWVLDILDRVASASATKTTTDARTPLRAAVSMLIGKKGLMYPDGYALVHQRFGVEHIDQLAPEQIGQAVEYVHRLVLEGEVLPAEKKGAYHFPKETAAPHDFERRAFINVNMTPDVLLDSRNRAPELELIEALERDGHDVAGAKIRILALRDAAAWQVKLLAMMEDVRWRLGHQADRIRQCTDQRGMNVVFDKKPTKKMVAAAQGALPLGSA